MSTESRSVAPCSRNFAFVASRSSPGALRPSVPVLRLSRVEVASPEPVQAYRDLSGAYSPASRSAASVRSVLGSAFQSRPSALRSSRVRPAWVRSGPAAVPPATGPAAQSSCEWRSVGVASPKSSLVSVLRSALRAARAKKVARLARRLARIAASAGQAPQYEVVPPMSSSASRESSWVPLGAVVTEVLGGVRAQPGDRARARKV